MEISKEYIENLNKKAQLLNSERQKKIGMRESAKQLYDKSVNEYKEKYGVVIDDTNLDQVIASVREDVTKQYRELAELVSSIESGEYMNNNTSNVQGVEQPQQDQQSTILPPPPLEEQPADGVHVQMPPPVVEQQSFNPNINNSNNSNIVQQEQPVHQQTSQGFQQPLAQGWEGQQFNPVANEPIVPQQGFMQQQQNHSVDIPTHSWGNFGVQTPQPEQGQGIPFAPQMQQGQPQQENQFQQAGQTQQFDPNAEFNTILGNNQ